jgi:hypothetical protein
MDMFMWAGNRFFFYFKPSFFTSKILVLCPLNFYKMSILNSKFCIIECISRTIKVIVLLIFDKIFFTLE